MLKCTNWLIRKHCLLYLLWLTVLFLSGPCDHSVVQLQTDVGQDELQAEWTGGAPWWHAVTDRHGNAGDQRAGATADRRWGHSWPITEYLLVWSPLIGCQTLLKFTTFALLSCLLLLVSSLVSSSSHRSDFGKWSTSERFRGNYIWAAGVSKSTQRSGKVTFLFKPYSRFQLERVFSCLPVRPETKKLYIYYKWK